MEQHLISLVIGYGIGSIPTAYWVVRSRAGVDIRSSGSGNVGARNTYDVTGSKSLGVIVMLIDISKGAAATFLPYVWFADQHTAVIAGATGAMLGHNYPVWLRFHGGRGLATAAGVMLLAGWIFVAVWCILWGAAYFRTKKILTSNIIASILATPVLLAIPDFFIRSVSVIGLTTMEIISMSAILCTLILMRHGDHFSTLLRGRNGAPT